MNILTKLFKRKEFKLEGGNLNYLSDLAEKIPDSKFNKDDIGKLESFIYFNPQNPYLHQLYAKKFFIRKENEKANKYFDKAINLGIKDGGCTLYTKALNNIFGSMYSSEALDAMELILNTKSELVNHNIGEIRPGIFIRKNEFGFSSFFMDLRNQEKLADIYAMSGRCYDAFKRDTEAADLIDKAISICPDNKEYVELKKQFKVY